MADIKYVVEPTLKWEGGLSNNPKDTASKYPSPYIYKNQKGWHTNKGITYATFEAASKNKYLGIKNDATTFLTMPAEVWMKIAKNLFWNPLYLDEFKSQALANLMFSWTWASGYGWKNRVQKYLKSKGITWNKSDYKNLPVHFNALVNKYGEQNISDEMFDQYREFYKSLNQPAFIKGWLNRLEDLQNYSNTLVKFAKENKGSVGGLLLLLGTATTVIIIAANK